MSLLELKKIKIGFKDNVVIKEANFVVDEGDFICVVGANGSGKSTLIKGILGLIKPFSGKIIFDKSLKTNIGYLPQELRLDDNFPATVFEVVMSGNLGRMGAKVFYGIKEREKAEDALKLLGIEKLEKQKFSELSGGQKQKALLARALVATSKLLILDEPSNNLDYKSREEFYQTLIWLNKEKKITIMMITHDLDADDLIGNKIVYIKNGEVGMAETQEYLRSFR